MMLVIDVRGVININGITLSVGTGNNHTGMPGAVALALRSKNILVVNGK